RRPRRSLPASLYVQPFGRRHQSHRRLERHRTLPLRLRNHSRSSRAWSAQARLSVPRLDDHGRPTGFTEEIKIGYIKFVNGSRIIAFSSNPYAMAVYGGDVGLDEFAKHPNAKLLWQTAQARVTWACDLAVWSSHDGEDTLFNQFAQQARAAWSQTLSQTSSETLSVPAPTPEAGPIKNPALSASGAADEASVKNSKPCQGEVVPSLKNHKSETINPKSPWNLYFKVTMPDAIELGLLDVI